MQIKNLFDPSKDIYRTIEKVITYGAAQEARLKAEIREYIVTESIEEQFEKLLDKMQTAMELGGEHDVGVWVSGFYGSGKSSFTKYLGLALDESVSVDGVRFLKLLQDRMNRPQTRALLASVAAHYPAAVVLLDLASEMVAGATMEDVSTVLYYKVLQWAGYSRNLKVAALERRLKKDGRYAEFLDLVQQALGVPWPEVQNDPLVIDSVLPEIAHQMYPGLFRTASAFNTETAEFVTFENERVKEMLDIVREKSGKRYALFIVDEVGQYVGSRPHLILNLDGLAKNLKAIGGGKAWIVGTAQQTLTEDDPKAALNSPALYKLKDRFPIQIGLESDDIKEICTRRLLGKSPEGERALGALFDRAGQALRYNTKLQDANNYQVDVDRAAFVNLYPFLPAHFGILIYLLGALAKSTGGIGLRSAIKVIQDILVEGPEGHTPVADQPVGWLATTVTLYDALERDIRRAYPSVHKAVEKAAQNNTYRASIHLDVAKTVAVLQILNNMPVTAHNVAALIHPGVEAPERRKAVGAAIGDLINDPYVPFGERDGNLCFFSEKINDIDIERAQLPVHSVETRRIQNQALADVFNPLPAVKLHGTYTVTSGLKAVYGAASYALAGERETIQMQVELADPSDYETVRARLLDESRQHAARNMIFLLGRAAPDVAERANEIYRCGEIASRYRNDPDQEVKDYCNAQDDRAKRLAADLARLLQRQLALGSFIFRGQPTAVESLNADVLPAAKAHLTLVAEQVFDRYAEAPLRADTALAEKFLRAPSLRAITEAIDPLHVVQMHAGKPSVNTGHKALVSILDYLNSNGTVDGKRLADTFTGAPFGWSPDTLRYLVAALLVAGQIKLKVSGREVAVNGQQALEALRNNNSFRAVGVMPREAPPSQEMLARAAGRLSEVVGDTVLPLEDEISKAATRHFPQFQLRYGPLAGKLESLGLPGVERVHQLSQDLADVLLTDASDAPARLGGESSALYEGLTWAAEVNVALKNGLEATVRVLQQYRRAIGALPDSGLPGQLRRDLAPELEQIGQRLGQDNFYLHGADFNSALTDIQVRVRGCANQMAESQRATIKEAQQSLIYLPEWNALTQEEQQNTLARLDDLALQPPADLNGLQQLLNQDYAIQTRARELKLEVQRIGHERAKAMHDGEVFTDSLQVPACIQSAAQLEQLVQRLAALKTQSGTYARIQITVEMGE